MNLSKAFKDHLYATNLSGSNKAASYIRALDMLGEILVLSNGPFCKISSIWQEESASVIDALYHYIKTQQRSGEIFQTDHPSSYWRNGYYSAALRSYKNFLIESKYELRLLEQYKGGEFVYDDFLFDMEEAELLVNEMPTQEGKEVIRKVKTRANQNVFRQKILAIYNQQCCITGLNIPQINRASHIIPWSEKKETRLDPANGLCLSATYDAAFDTHLISLDEDYRVIISQDIKSACSRQVVQDYFKGIEGQKISLPNAFKPKQEYLIWHRKRLRS